MDTALQSTVDLNRLHSLDLVCAVIVTFNSAHCIPALAQSLGSLAHIIVVDNGSVDDTLTAVAQHLPQAQCVALGKNIGFGSANNVALRMIASQNLAPYALLVNPDCGITPTDLAQLIQTADAQPQAAIVAPLIVGKDNTVQHSYQLPKHAYPYRPQTHACDGLLCVGFITGACWLARVDALMPLGGFDEQIFLYYEDDDLCLRLHQAGHNLLIDPAARAVHASRGSVKMRSGFQAEYLRGYHHTRAKLYYLRKWQGESKARKQRVKLVFTTAFVLLPVRLLSLNSRYLGRAWGRMMGLVHTQI